MVSLNQVISTPLQAIQDEITYQMGVELYIKREDLIHPQISGNKWRKLKYNLIEAKEKGKTSLLTFGGAFSNHIYAMAAAGKLYGFETIGLIRGEETMPLNPTLSFAKTSGMQLHYINRKLFKKKEEPFFMDELHDKFGDFYLISEGGSNALAVKGCMEIIQGITINYEYVCCACGTGGTLAGLIAGCNGKQKIIGFSSLKGGIFLEEEVMNLLINYKEISGKEAWLVPEASWMIQSDYHFGGYAKSTRALIDFIKWFENTHYIKLEQVYTGKMLFGIYDLIRTGYFNRGDRIIAIHTGGLQGRLPELDAP